MKDSKGNDIEEGNIIEVISISPDILKDQQDADQYDANTIIGEKFEIDEIDDDKVWISKWWDRNDGGKQLHCLSLLGSQVELCESK